MLLFALNADQTISITVQISEMTFEALLENIEAAGATDEMLSEVVINDIYCLMYNPSETVLALYAVLDDETVLAVTFQTASAETSDAMGNTPLEMFGSLAEAEE